MNQIEQTSEKKDMLTAEYWVKGFAQSPSGNPIQNFKFNILKAKILHATAHEVNTLWPKIHPRVIKNEEPKDISSLLDALSKLKQTGSATYHAYTEQALVSAVSASEIYFKDKLAYTIQNDKRILNHFLDKEIKVKRVVETGLNLTNDIGKLIVENMNFQDLDSVQKEYKKVFGSKFDLCNEEEIKKLKQIFAIRNVIVHRAGIVDHAFISETRLNYEIGNKLFFERDEILQKIDFIEKIITDLELKIENRTKKPLVK